MSVAAAPAESSPARRGKERKNAKESERRKRMMDPPGMAKGKTVRVLCAELHRREQMVVATPPTMTVEEFFKLHGQESNVELVRGQIVRYPMPGAKHGQVCMNAGMTFGQFI